MPQVGQGPGFGSRTSGHMGQTYAGAAGCAGLAEIPTDADVGCTRTDDATGFGAPIVINTGAAALGFKY